MVFETSDWEFLKRIGIVVVVWLVVRTFFEQQLITLPYQIQFVIGTLFLYILPAILISHFSRWGDFVNKKMVGTVAVLASVDLLAVPTLVNTQGVFTGQTIFLGTGTIDYVLFQFFSNFGITGNALFLAIYGVGTIGLALIGIFLLSEKQLKQVLT